MARLCAFDLRCILFGFAVQGWLHVISGVWGLCGPERVWVAENYTFFVPSNEGRRWAAVVTAAARMCLVPVL